MTLPAVYDGMTIYRGMSFSRTFVCKNNGAVVDLTGYEAEFTAKDGDDIVFSLTSRDGTLPFDRAAGAITVPQTPTQTAAIEADELEVSLLISLDDNVFPLLVGFIPVSDRAF